MWLLCHHVVSFIVIQRDVIKWIVIFAIIPATLAATNLPVVLDTETGTSVYVSFLFRVLTDRNLNGPYQNIRTVLRNHSSKSVSLTSKMWSNSAFYNRCSELSPEIMSCSLVAAATLAASPWVDMSIKSHSQGRSVCVLFLSIWYTPSTHSISFYPLYPLVETMEQATMVRVIRVLGECPIVPSASLSVNSFCFLTEFIGELKDQFQRQLVVKYSAKADSPLQTIEKQLDNNIRIKQQLKLTQGL